MCIRDSHISVDKMLYSVPYEYIKKKVDVKITDNTVEIFYNHNRIASHLSLIHIYLCLCIYMSTIQKSRKKIGFQRLKYGENI